ncbi:MAG: hypothetical protein WAN66_21865 [Limnoraphis robusta]
MKFYNENQKTTTYLGDSMDDNFIHLERDLTEAFINTVKFFELPEKDFPYSDGCFEFGVTFSISKIEKTILEEKREEWKVLVCLGIIDYAVSDLLFQNQNIVKRIEDDLNEFLGDYYLIPSGVEVTIRIYTKNYLDTLSLLKDVRKVFELKSYNEILKLYINRLNNIFLSDYYIEHLLKKLNVIYVDNKGREVITNYRNESSIKVTPSIYSKGKESNFIEWKGHYFRSPQEVEIAKELDSRQILFFPNAGCRVLEEKGMHTREIDFLVIIDGNMGILECDSERYHQSAARDHKRDGLFNAHGIWFIRRYTSQDCQDPKKVVDGFISDFEKFIRHKK